MTRKRRVMIWAALATSFALVLSTTTKASIDLIHEFPPRSGYGARPYGSLTQDGSVLYGMTFLGGDDALRVVFKINTDGFGFELIHEFSGGVDDGARPLGSLIQDGSVFYGMTSEGGDSDAGVVFKIKYWHPGCIVSWLLPLLF